MALISRSAEENFFNSLPSELHDDLIKNYYDQNEEDLIFLTSFFNFSLGTVGKKYLISRGMRLSPIGGVVSHSHPICKSIENHLIYVVMPQILSKAKRVALMSIKENKARYLFKKTSAINRAEGEHRGRNDFKGKETSGSSFNTVLNRMFEPKDYQRYDDITSINCPYNNKSWFNVVGNLLGPKSGVDLIFIHDEVHHWSKSDMASFLIETEIENFAFSVVFPPEVLRGSKSSMNPDIYSFNIEGDDLFFFPDSANIIPYCQSVEKGSWILKVGQMGVTFKNGQREVYTFQMIENHGAHSLFLCTRKGVKGERRRFFKDFSGSDLTNLSKERVILEERIREKSIYCSHELLEKVINYIVCLKKPDIESALAKLRQLTDSACHPDEVYILHNIIAAFTSCKDFFERGLLSFASFSLKFLFDASLQALPDLEALLGSTSLSKWRFLKSLFINLKRFEVSILTETIDGDDVLNREGESRSSSILRSIRERTSFMNQGVLSSVQSMKTRDSTYSSRRHLNMFLIVSSQDGESRVNISDLTLMEPENLALREELNDNSNSLIYCLVIKSRRTDWIKGFLQYPKNLFIEEIEECLEGTPTLNEFTKSIEEIELMKKDNPKDSELKEEGRSSRGTKLDSERKNSCLIRSIAAEINVDPDVIISRILSQRDSISSSLAFSLDEDMPISIKDADLIAKLLDLRVTILDGEGVIQVGSDDEDKRSVTICKRRGHAFNLPGAALSKDKFLSGLSRKISNFFFGTLTKPELFSCFDLSIDIKSASLFVDAIFHNDFGAFLDRSKIKKGGLMSQKLGDPSSLIQSLRTAKKDMRVMTKASLLPILGFAGSGKTSSLLKILHDANLRDIEWISPRSELLKDLSFGNESVKELKNFSTFEIGLSRSKEFNRMDNIVIVLDETFLLPNGFIDFLVLNIVISNFISDLSKSGGKFIEVSQKELISKVLDHLSEGLTKRIGPEVLIIALGDPLQTKFFSSEAPSLNRARSFREMIGGSEKKNYLNFSRRFGKFLDNSFSIQELPDKEDLKLKVISSLESMSLDEGSFSALVASQEDKRKFSFNFDQISTIGEAQGRTFDEVLIIVTRSLYKADKETILTAITRSRNTVWIWVPKDMEGNLKGPGEGSFLMNNILAKNSDGIREIVDSMKSNLRLFNFEESLGSDFELKTEGDLFLRSELSLLERKNISYDDLSSIDLTHDPVQPKMKVHISLAPQNFSSLESSCFMKAREYREIKEGTKWSEQFNDVFKMGGFNSDSFNQSCSPSAVFPRHQSSDSVTFWAAVKKRLVFKDPYTNMRNANKSMETGRTMLNVFLEHVKLNPDWNDKMYEDSRAEFEEKKISKSSALIANHSIRSDTDWPKENFFLFMKNQSCKKLEKMFCDGKAGQTLACFSHSVLMRFGPLNRYIEKKVSESLPSRFYIHQKKNFEDLEKWVIREAFDQECTESDYEAFDASQDHFALAFEIELMKFLQVPDDLIDDYKWLKCHTNCRLGNMAIMRFTGEFCTFMFNTLVNMVFTFLAYDISNASICFAGDDMCANKRLKKQSKYCQVLDNFSLKAKVDFTFCPSFCGWRLFKEGIVKSPTLVAARVEMAKQKTVSNQRGYSSNDIALVCDSYFLEVMFTYRKGDLIFGLLSEREMYHFYNVMRFFVKYKRYLSKTSREMLESDKESNLYLGGEVGSSILFESFRDSLYPKPRNSSSQVLTPGHERSDLQGSVLLNCGEREKHQKISCTLGFRSFCESVVSLKEIKRVISGGSVNLVSQSQLQPLCQSLMGKSFWNLHQVQTKRFSLMGSLLPTYTVMLEASKERQLMLSRDSKSTLLSQLKDQKERLLLIFHSLMKWKGRPSISRMTHLAFSTIQLSFSLLRGFLTQLVRLRGSLSFLMKGQPESKQLLRKGSPLTLVKPTGHIICTVLIHSCQYLTHILKELSSCASNSLVHILYQVPTASLSILESCTGYSTILMTVCARTQSRIQNFRSCKQQIKYLISKVPSISMSSAFMRIDSLRTLGRKGLFLGKEMVSCGKKREFLECASTKLTQFLNKLGQFKSRLMKSFLDLLGQVLSDSLEEFLLGYQKESFESFWKERQEKMSVKNQLEREMREGIQEYIWRNIIDAANTMHMTPAANVQLTQELAERKAFILRHFFKYLAGNLAVEGTSEQTKYPDHTFRLAPIPATRVGGQENLILEMNMVETIGAMRAWRDTLPANHPNKNATLRQMATPFADHALEFLVEHANEVRTNLAASHPELAKAPEVAFDFARGLSPRHTVHALRAQTIGAFTGRTFRTEGQKGVFTAQGTVNVSYDG